MLVDNITAFYNKTTNFFSPKFYDFKMILITQIFMFHLMNKVEKSCSVKVCCFVVKSCNISHTHSYVLILQFYATKFMNFDNKFIVSKPLIH